MGKNGTGPRLLDGESGQIGSWPTVIERFKGHRHIGGMLRTGRFPSEFNSYDSMCTDLPGVLNLIFQS